MHRNPLCARIQDPVTNQMGRTMADQVAQAAIAFQFERTGHAPKKATVVLSGETLVITLHDALSQAERALARSPEGAAKVQEFHRELFINSAEQLRREILRITGVAVQDSAEEMGASTGDTAVSLASGTMVQVFQMARGIPAEDWNGPAHAGAGT